MELQLPNLQNRVMIRQLLGTYQQVWTAYQDHGKDEKVKFS